MMWLSSYVGSNVALIIAVVLLVVALGVIAWFAKNWKVAVMAIAVVAAGLAYQQIDKSAYQRRVSEEAAEKVKLLQDRINTLNAVAAADAERAKADAEKITELEKKANETPPNNRIALPVDSARRVQSIR